MARLALVNASEATAVLVRASSRSHKVAECSVDNIDASAAILVLDLREDTPVDSIAASLATSAPETPVLVLADPGTELPYSLTAGRRTLTLHKPLNLLDLRVKIRELLKGEPGPSAATAQPLVSTAWFSAPRFTSQALRALDSFRLLDGPVWLVGEPGTGVEEAALALCRLRRPKTAAAIWEEGDPVAALAQPLGRNEALWVPALDGRSQADQRDLERTLAAYPNACIVVSSGDNADAAVAEGRLSRSLHLRLSAAALRLAPLRERLGDMEELATWIGRRVAETALAAGEFRLSPEALAQLIAYPWPENLAELEAALTRSVLALVPGEDGVVHLTASELRFSPDLDAPPPSGQDPSLSIAMSQPSFAETRRSNVVPLGAVPSARGGSSVSSSDASDQAAEIVTPSGTVPASSQAGIEALLSAFAHDLRNPMSTIKTFAALQAANASEDDGELARLSMEACERVDGLLEFLQRYGELTPGEPTTFDLMEMLADVADSTGSLEFLGRAPLLVHADVTLARFAADAIARECEARVGADPATADLAADRQSVEVRVPVGTAPIDRLGKWVDGPNLPWRLALARDAARRAGGDLNMETQDGELRLGWRLPLAKEGAHDQQAHRADRRRRSRSS